VHAIQEALVEIRDDARAVGVVDDLDARQLAQARGIEIDAFRDQVRNQGEIEGVHHSALP